jgi:predicted deacylase
MISNVSFAATETLVEKPSSYSINYFDKNVGGDVLKNFKISKNMPKSTLSKKIVSMVKKGSVILKFGNDNGSKILVCAGIHGDESAANLATLKFLETIKDKKIEGTIYVIPFIIPKSTSINKRSWYNPYKKYNVDPNRCANVPGTPGYKIVQFAKENNISYIIDVHSGGGLTNYKNGLVIGNKPRYGEEINWLKYIKKTTNSKIAYSILDKEYMRCYAKINNINTITLEVERDKGSISKWTKIEYRMLVNACKYFNLF